MVRLWWSLFSWDLSPPLTPKTLTFGTRHLLLCCVSCLLTSRCLLLRDIVSWLPKRCKWTAWSTIGQGWFQVKELYIKLKQSVSGLSSCGKTTKANLSGRLIAPDTEVVPSTGLKPSCVAHGTALCLTLLVYKVRITAEPTSKSSGKN